MISEDSRWRLEVRERGVDIYDAGAASGRLRRTSVLALRHASMDQAIVWLMARGADVDAFRKA